MMTWWWRDIISCTLILIFSVSDEIKSQSISRLDEQSINLCLLLCAAVCIISCLLLFSAVCINFSYSSSSFSSYSSLNQNQKGFWFKKYFPYFSLHI